MSHANAPLTPAGRLRLIDRCQTRPIAHVAAEAGVSRQCLSKWVGRFRLLGAAGLVDRSSAPHSCPGAVDPVLVARIEGLRRGRKLSARLITAQLAAEGTPISQATVGRYLVRLGISRRRDLDPAGNTNRRSIPIVARYPGHMIHVDVKKVGRIPAGGGWRLHGRNSPQAKAVDRAKAATETAARVDVRTAADTVDARGEPMSSSRD